MKKSSKRDETRNPGKSLDIGATIQRLREAQGLSGVTLCRRAQGFDPRTLTALEKGRIKNPSIATLQALGKGLGMMASDIFREAEIEDPACFSLGSQKGFCEIDFPAYGVHLISFTPLTPEFFCGKVILEGQKAFDEKLLKHSGFFFMMTLVGQVEGVFEGKKVTLREGENLFFRGTLRFHVRNPAHRASTLLFVTVPSCLSQSSIKMNG